jgi:hypothetical protein
MELLRQVPEWMGAAFLAAVIAALGYVAKLLIELLREVQTTRRVRRARLVELFSLLNAGYVAFRVQIDNRNRLEELITVRDKSLNSNRGYERLFKSAFPHMTDDERELHSIIRAYTVHTMRPLNESILQWLKEDTYFKAGLWRRGNRAYLARRLAILEAHLLLWQAKYAVWINSDNPQNSLVYLADEEKHGPGFPTGIENDILQVIQPGASMAELGFPPKIKI